jgi:hypothetical protein
MGNEVKWHEDKLLKLKKVLYGLKHASRACYSHIDSYFLKNGFVKYSWISYLDKNKREWWYFYRMLIYWWLDFYRQ